MEVSRQSPAFIALTLSSEGSPLVPVQTGLAYSFSSAAVLSRDSKVARFKTSAVKTSVQTGLTFAGNKYFRGTRQSRGFKTSVQTRLTFTGNKYFRGTRQSRGFKTSVSDETNLYGQ